MIKYPKSIGYLLKFIYSIINVRGEVGMDSIASRVKYLRQELKLSQKEFGERIGVSQTKIYEIEKNNRLSNLIKRAICNEFELNEKWLLTGEGDMYSANHNNKEIELFIASFKDERVKKLILRISTLNDKGLEMVSNVVDLLANDEILMELKKQKKE